MHLETFFIERQHLTGICHNCGKPYANIERDDGTLIDSLLEEWQPLWDCRPIVLTADDVHSRSILGEWCSLACFEQSVVGYLRARDPCTGIPETTTRCTPIGQQTRIARPAQAAPPALEPS